MKISKTKIEKRMKKKTDTSLAGAIIKLKKTNAEVARLLARPKRLWECVNVGELKMDGDVLVAGKVLSSGELGGKRKIVAWSASDRAVEKIKAGGGEFVSIVDEMKKNPELKGLEVFG